MSEQERVNFLKAAVSRAPGKRQIKPSAAIFEDGGLAMDDDESDEDFSADGQSIENSDEEEDNATATEGESDTESSGAGDAEDSDIEILETQPDKLHNVAASTSAIPSKPNGPLICSICLNMKHSTKGAEVIQCDKCGLAVHESCYIVEETGDDQSTSSSSSTEPWFCEPCVFGLGIVPHCELCPSRYGAFKKADVGGGWVHLLCALYVPGISFADVEHLSGVSWQELDYKTFGRKQCIACQDKLEARTGITVQCEAGLCKNFYHVTCAQRLGLLVDVDTDDSQWSHYSERNGMPDCNFLLCKRHNHNDLLQPKKDTYIRFLRQENQRMISLKRPVLNSRQEFKRRNQLQRYVDRMKKIGSNSSVLPSIHNKKTKMLHTNAQFLNAFAEKAELLGMERKDFEDKFMTIATEQLPNLAPAFSSSFVRYFERREEVELPDAEIRLAKAQADKAKVLSEQQMLESNVKLMQNELIGLHERHTQADQLLNRLCNVLYTLTGAKKHIVITKPKVNTTAISKISQKRSSPISPTTTSRSKANTTATKDSQTATSSTTSSATPSTPTKQSVRRPNILSRSSPAKPKISFQRTSNNAPLAIKIPGHEKSNASSPKSPRALTSKRSSRASISSPSPGTSRKLSISSGRNEAKRSNDKIEPPTSAVHQWLAPNIAPKSASSSLLETMQMHKCHTCEKMTDQHLLIYCGTCQHHYHLGCLDPPLKRMPIQNRNCVFECSDCACPSTSEEEMESKKEDEGEKDDLNLSVAARRKVRKRISIYKSPHMLDSLFSSQTKKRSIKPVVKGDKKRTNTKENTTPKIETLLNGEHSPGRHEQISKQPTHSETDAFGSSPPRKKTVLHNPCLRQNNLLREDRSDASQEIKGEVLQ